MPEESPERADIYPYRRRIAEIMSRPPVTAEGATTLGAAARLMRERGISSLLLVDGEGRPTGILTERDLLVAVADQGAAALARPIADLARAPVHSIEPDAYVHAAIARIDRLRLRHLAVVEPLTGKLVGVVSARSLLQHRAQQVLVLGDEIAVADGPVALAAIRARLPELATGLLREGMGALEVAGLLSKVLRDVNARVCALAERAMERNGGGAAPAPWCFLVLGSGGRGESLLAPDQDNAIVHAGEADDDPWFAEVGKRAADMLDASGIPYCKGGVMAADALWRHNLVGWQKRIDRWVARLEGENLLNVDIFYDFRPVHGDHGLADALRRAAMTAAQAPLFLAILAEQLFDLGTALGPFGGFVTEDDRIDLKKGALLPVVAGARVLALRFGVSELETAARLAAIAGRGHIGADDATALRDAHEFVTRLILEQQIIDAGAGREPSTRVELRRLDRTTRRRLRAALKRIKQIDWTVRDALSADPRPLDTPRS